MTDKTGVLTSNEYNERYSRKVPIQLGDLEQFVMAFGVVDDYIEWMRFFKGVDIPGNGPAVIKQLKEARTLALALYNAPPPSETGVVPTPEPMEGNGKHCYYCGKACNGFAGNPSEWPIPLCHPDEPGRVKWHHTGCVSDRLHGRIPLDGGSQKAGACPPIDAKLNASIEAVAKVLQEEAASDPTFPVRGVANYAGLAGRIIRAVAGSKEKS